MKKYVYTHIITETTEEKQKRKDFLLCFFPKVELLNSHRRKKKRAKNNIQNTLGVFYQTEISALDFRICTVSNENKTREKVFILFIYVKNTFHSSEEG